jgi:hypothetical protein
MPKAAKRTKGHFITFTLRAFVGLDEDSKITARVDVLDSKGKPIAYDDHFMLETWWSSSRSYKTPDEVAEIVRQMQAKYEKEAPQFLLLEAANFLEDIQEHDGNIEETQNREDREDTVEFHLSKTADYLNGIFSIQPPPKKTTRKRGQWTKAELIKTLNEITRSLPKEDRTFPRAADAMKQVDPERAPASGNALRVLCDRYGVKATRLRQRIGKRKNTEKRT